MSQYADVVIVTPDGKELPVVDEHVKEHPLVDLYDERSKTVKLDVNVKDGKVFIMPLKVFELTYPENLPQTLDSSLFDAKGRQPRVGGFGIIERNGKILIIERSDNGKRYIPGGLVEKTDKDIHETIRREVKEETNFDLGERKGQPSHIYEAIIHRNGNVSVRNIMVMFFYTVDDLDDTELIPQEGECKSVEWIRPYEFWKRYSRDPNYSLPSMKGILQRWVAYKFESEGHPEDDYLELIKRIRNKWISIYDDSLAFDLALIEGLRELRYGDDFGEWLESIYRMVKRDFDIWHGWYSAKQDESSGHCIYENIGGDKLTVTQATRDKKHNTNLDDIKYVGLVGKCLETHTKNQPSLSKYGKFGV